MPSIDSHFRALFYLILFLNPSRTFSEPWLDKMPHDHYNRLTLSGDVLSITLPSVALIASLQDSHPFFFQRSALITGGVLVSTDLLKRAFNYTSLGERPNGYHSSFPSGHASSAFLGARLIHRQFGMEYGVPAYALATMTAYSRVEGRYHHIHDVLAGAALVFVVDYCVDRGIENGWIAPMFSATIHGLNVNFLWNF